MIKILTFSFLFALTFTACQTNSSKNQDDNLRTSFFYDTTKTAVISWEKNFRDPFDSLNYKPAILTQEDIAQIEKSLIQSVTDYNKSLSDGHDEYKIDLNKKDYKKQLVAGINSNGEKEVWVNCFCDDWDKGWRTQIILVEDGGPCYFRFKVNLTTNKIYDLMVNGFA